MRIGVFVEYFPPSLGSDRRIFELMKRLSKEHEVHFLALPPFRLLLRSEAEKNSHSLASYVREDAECEGIRGHYVPISPSIANLWHRSIVLGYLCTMIWVSFHSFRILTKIMPDIIVLNHPSPYTGLIGYLEGKLLRRRIVLDFCDLIAQYALNLINIKKDCAKGRLLIFIQNQLAKKAGLVVVPTRFIQEYSASLGVPEDRIVIIPNGVDVKDFNPHRRTRGLSRAAKLKNHGEKVCVYCGRLDGWAGITLILDLCDAAQRAKMNVSFLLVGSGAAKVVAASNVVLMAEVAYGEVPSILAAADVILIPFPLNEVSHAASPLKLFEGMAMEKPVIASRVSGVLDVIVNGKNGLIVNSNDISDWLARLAAVLKLKDSLKEIGRNARQTVAERYEWSLLSKRYEEVLNNNLDSLKQLTQPKTNAR